MNKHLILQKAYSDLDIDFKLNDKHIYVKQFDRLFFKYQLRISENSTERGNFPGITTSKINTEYNVTYGNEIYVINKGLSTYVYHNIYEVLFWYYYYTTKYKHVDNYSYNKGHLSRIPEHYTNIDSKKGLNIVKAVLNKILLKYGGVPKYYNNCIFEDVFTIK